MLLETFKRSERIFKSLLESILQPVYVVDKTQKLLYANTAGMEILNRYHPNIYAGKTPLFKRYYQK